MTWFEYFFSKLPEDIQEKVKNLNQNEQYYPEKTVYEHMKLVFNYLLKNYYHIYPKEQFMHKNVYNDYDYTVLYTAIFHDLGKIDTTTEENGKIRSIGHEIKSLEYVDKYIKSYIEKVGLFCNINKLKNIVKDHMKVQNYFIMKDNKKKLFKNKYYFNDLMFFSKADKVSYNFFNPSQKTFIMLCGIPGSGKSSYLKKLDYNEKKKTIVFSPDQIKLEKYGDINNQEHNKEIFDYIKQRIKEELNQNNYDIIVLDATNVDSKLRNLFIKELPVNIKKILYVFIISPFTAYARIQDDLRNKKIRANVPFETILNFYLKLQKDFSTINYEPFDKIIIR